MEKFAILALTASHMPAPFSILGRAPVDHLVMGLERSGVRRFLLVGDMPATDAARLVDRIKARGLGASYHRTLGELDAVLPAEARLTLVAGDAWIAPELLASIQTYDKAVLVTERMGWERLDRDHFWAGLAVFGRRAVSAGADLPDSWDIASTLLRQLTQDGARRIDADAQGADLAPVRVTGSDMARQIERFAIGAGPSAHWFDRLITRPLASGVLTLLRARPAMHWPLFHLPVGVALLSAVAGAMGSIAGAAAGGLVALGVDRALQRIDPERREQRTMPWQSSVMLGLLAAALLLLSRRADLSLPSCAILLLSASLCAGRLFERPWNLLVPLLPVTACMLLLLSLFLGPMAVDVTSLVCLAALAAERWSANRSERSALKRN